MLEEENFNIPLILGTVRTGRQSEKVARFLFRKLEETKIIRGDFIDLREWNLPMMKERLRFHESPPQKVVELGSIFNNADGILIVSPEYNHSYPGVLKNALDYFYPEYKRKPFAIATVSGGGFGGLNCLGALRQLVLGLGGFPIPGSFPVSKVQDAFDENNNPTDDSMERRAEKFIDELLWFTEAIKNQKKREAAG